MELYNYIRRIPVLRLLIPLITGTVIGYYFTVPDLYLFFVFTGVSFLIISNKVNNSITRGFLVNIVWITLGWINIQWHKPAGFNLFSEEKEAKITAYISDQVNIKDTKQIITLRLLKINDSIVADKNWHLLLTLKTDTTTKLFTYGDKVFFISKILPVKNFGNPNEFNYKEFLYRKHIVARSFITPGKIIKLNGFQGSFIKKTAIRVRHYLLKQYKKHGIDGQNFAVLSALSLGYKDDLEQETKALFAHTGAMHVLAVSGLHVGIIFAILMNLLKKLPFKLRNLLELPVILSGIWIFALISGLSPSVSRASLMFSLMVVVKKYRKNTNFTNLIFLAALIQLSVNPMVIFEVGFQLSYSAVLSIISLQPIISSFLSIKNKFLRQIWDLTAVSIAATIGTLPFSLYYFHQFPTYFVLANLVVVPLSGILLQLAIAFLLLAFIPIAGHALAYILNFGISIMLKYVSLLDKLPASSFQNINFNGWETVFVVLIFSLLFSFIRFKHFSLLKNLLLTIVIYTGLLFFHQIDQINNGKFIVYNFPKTSVYQIIDKAKSIVINSGSATNPYIQQMLALNAAKSSAQIISDSIPEFFSFKKRKIALILSEKWNFLIARKKLDIDYVILSNKYQASLRHLGKLFRFKTIVFDSSISYSKRKKWIKEAQELGINFYDVSQQGAFILQ